MGCHSSKASVSQPAIKTGTVANTLLVSTSPTKKVLQATADTVQSFDEDMGKAVVQDAAHEATMSSEAKQVPTRPEDRDANDEVRAERVALQEFDVRGGQCPWPEVPVTQSVSSHEGFREVSESLPVQIGLAQEEVWDQLQTPKGVDEAAVEMFGPTFSAESSQGALKRLSSGSFTTHGTFTSHGLIKYADRRSFAMYKENKEQHQLDSVRRYAEESLGPAYSKLDLASDENKAFIEKLMKMDSADLETALDRKKESIDKLETNFKGRIKNGNNDAIENFRNMHKQTYWREG